MLQYILTYFNFLQDHIELLFARIKRDGYNNNPNVSQFKHAYGHCFIYLK